MWINPTFNPNSLQAVCEFSDGTLSATLIPGDVTRHQCFSFEDTVKFRIISTKAGFNSSESDTFVFSRSGNSLVYKQFIKVFVNFIFV